MTVYSVFSGFDYESESILGIYADKDKAIEAANIAMGDNEALFDYVLVREFEMGEVINTVIHDSKYVVFESARHKNRGW